MPSKTTFWIASGLLPPIIEVTIQMIEDTQKITNPIPVTRGPAFAATINAAAMPDALATHRNISAFSKIHGPCFVCS